VSAVQFKRKTETNVMPSGGLEMLFSDTKKHDVTISFNPKDEKRPNIQFLVDYLCDNLLTDPRKELFVIDNSV